MAYQFLVFIVLSTLKMADVAAESLVNKFAFLFSICLIYSRIILNKLSIHQKTLFRKCEKTFKSCEKFEADLKYQKLFSKY